MALFKILRGNAANLPKEMKDGYAYFCTDTHDFYIDYTNSNGQLTRGQLNAKDADHATNADNATKASKADKLTTGRTIGLKGAVTATATSFDGSSNIEIPINTLKEAYLTWGGKNFSATYGPIDAAMVPLLGTNRLAFLKESSITLEYSRDAGTTWQALETKNKHKIFGHHGSNRTSFTIGNNTTKGTNTANNYLLRITVDTIDASVYTSLNKFAIYITASGSTNCWCTIRAKRLDNVNAGNDVWTTFADQVHVDGWGGWNIINTSNIITAGYADSHYQKLEFTFGCTGHNNPDSYTGLAINTIMGFGGVGWTTPSSQAAYGTLYSYDCEQNATFPKSLTSGGQLYSKGTLKVDGASTLTGAVTSGALTASSLKSNGALTVTGNSTLTGTLTTSGAATFNSTIAGKEDVNFQKKLTVSGDTTLAKLSATNITASGTLGVTGATTLTSLTTSGNTSVGGTLKATGATTLSSTLTVGSTTTLNAALNVNGASSLYGNLTVTGNTTLGDGTGDTVTTSGAFTAGGATSLNSTLGVKEKGTFEKDLLVKGNTTLGNDATNDTTTLNSKLIVNGTTNTKSLTATNITATNDLDVTGATTLGSTLGVTGNTTIGGTLGVTGATTLTGKVIAKGQVELGDASSDATTVKGTLAVNSSTTVNGLSYLRGNTYVTGLLSATNYMEAPEFRGYLTGQAQSAAAIEWIYF